MEIVCLPRAVKFGYKNGVGGAAFLSISRCHLLHREPDYDYVYIFRACVYLVGGYPCRNLHTFRFYLSSLLF